MEYEKYMTDAWAKCYRSIQNKLCLLSQRRWYLNEGLGHWVIMYEKHFVHAWHVIHSSKEQHSPASLTFPMVQSRWKWSHCVSYEHWSSSYSRIWRNQHLYDNSFHQQRWLRERDALITSDSALMRASLKLCSSVKNWVTWSIFVLWNLDLVSR